MFRSAHCESDEDVEVPRKHVGRRPPKKIIIIRNKDKGTAEKWDEKRCRDIGNFPGGSRICIVGACNVGKTNLIKNIILHAAPRYQECYLIHPDIEHSREFEDMDMTDEIDTFPPVESWDHIDNIKTCCVIDDMESPKESSEQYRNLGLIMRYVSSHKKMSIIYSHQSWFSIPQIVKKMSNVFIIYKPKPRNELELITNRVGMKKGSLKEMFNTIATGYRDSICIDCTENTPAPLRLNIWKKIYVEDSDDDAER